METTHGKACLFLTVSLMILVFSLAHAISLPTEFDVDRPGCDYKSFVVPGANDARTYYKVCRDSCAADPSCRAWNFDPRSGTPKCFLKNCEPAATVAKGTVGGQKISVEMSSFGDENHIDRPGCDYRSFAEVNPFFCLTACALDPICQAWNFDSRKTVPTCFLKNCVPAPTVSNGNTGGVKYH